MKYQIAFDKAPESYFPTEPLPGNDMPMDPYFGPFFQLMRKARAAGGSEFGLGMTLFSLAVSIRATNIVEIGRFKGFSALCLASALRFLDIGWQEPAFCKQRPDVDYANFEATKQRKLFSIDPFPNQDAATLLEEANLTQYVEFINHPSDQVKFDSQADLIFIDGDHTYEGCRRDVDKFVPYVRPGGYFILHDYFGWWDSNGKNMSPIKMVTDELVAEGRYQQVLIDTGYMSFTIFRVPNPKSDNL